MSDTTEQTQPNMDTTQTLSPATVTAIAKVVLEHPNGTSHRLVYQNHEGWNPQKDLSLIDLTQGGAALNAIANFVTGIVKGNAKFFTVAPVAKLGYENGTGAFAYVRSDYVPGEDDFAVDVDGVSIFLTVKPEDVPDEWGYRRLYLDNGTLYSKKSWEKVYTNDNNPGLYWRCRTYSAILSGCNVSASVGERLLPDAEEVIKVVNSDDPTTANNTRRYVGRVSTRFTKSTKAVEHGIVSNAIDTGKAPSIGASDLIVPLQGGGTINLVRFTKAMPIRLATEGGMLLRPRYLSDDTDVARLALATVIREQKLAVVID